MDGLETGCYNPDNCAINERYASHGPRGLRVDCDSDSSKCKAWIWHQEMKELFSSKWNVGDWSSLETVEINDTIGGFKITEAHERVFIRATGIILAQWAKAK